MCVCVCVCVCVQLVLVDSNNNTTWETGVDRVITVPTPPQCESNTSDDTEGGSFLLICHHGLPEHVQIMYRSLLPGMGKTHTHIHTHTAHTQKACEATLNRSQRKPVYGVCVCVCVCVCVSRKGPDGVSVPPSLPTRCHFTVPHFTTRPGQHLLVVGSPPELGAWDPEGGLTLKWQPGHACECDSGLTMHGRKHARIKSSFSQGTAI